MTREVITAFLSATIAATVGTAVMAGSVKLADVLERVQARVSAWWYDDDEIQL